MNQSVGLCKKRIVLTAVGSLGDLHPYIAIALGLKARGHDAVIASSECYRRKIKALGLGFSPLRPDSDAVSDPEVMSRYMDSRRGTERVLRDWILPALRDSYQDTLAAARGADLLVAHPLTFATRLAAETQAIPWVSTAISPVCLFSAHDPPLPPGYPGLSKVLWLLPPPLIDQLGRLVKRATRCWAQPWYRLRHDLGLPPTTELNPLVDGMSPALHLALFSELLAPRQRDWPPSTVVTGFPFFDRQEAAGLPEDLVRFLDDGPPPIVFTLGSSAASIAGPFYHQSVAAAVRLNRRAVLILGDARIPLPTLPGGIAAFEYAPFSELFPRAAAVVFPGGIGSTGLVMRAGCPALVVPHAHDQPDNAARLGRLGISRTLSRRRYTADRATVELGILLDDDQYARRSTSIAGSLTNEDGVNAACNALQEVLEKP